MMKLVRTLLSTIELTIWQPSYLNLLELYYEKINAEGFYTY